MLDLDGFKKFWKPRNKQSKSGYFFLKHPIDVIPILIPELFSAPVLMILIPVVEIFSNPYTYKGILLVSTLSTMITVIN